MAWLDTINDTDLAISVISVREISTGTDANESDSVMRFGFPQVFGISGYEAGSRNRQIAPVPKSPGTSSDCRVILSSRPYEKLAFEISESWQRASDCEIGEPVAKHENGILPFQAKTNFDYSCQEMPPQR